MGGEPGMGGGGGGGGSLSTGGSPCGVNPADEMSKAATTCDMGDVFMKYEAYDLAYTAYSDALKDPAQNHARARRGMARAASLLKVARRLPPPPPPPPLAVQMAAMGQLGLGGETSGQGSGMPGSGPPGSPGMSSPGMMAAGMGANSGGYQTSGGMAAAGTSVVSF